MKKELYFASSDAPLIGNATEVAYLDDNDYGYVSLDEIAVLKMARDQA